MENNVVINFYYNEQPMPTFSLRIVIYPGHSSHQRYTDPPT